MRHPRTSGRCCDLALIPARAATLSIGSRRLEENRKLSREEPEYEILDTGVFDKDEYFDVTIVYAKQNARDIFIRIDITNRFDKEAEITVLPLIPAGRHTDRRRV